MMEHPLRLHAVTYRAEHYLADKPVTTRRTDGSVHTQTLGVTVERARQLVGALRALGVESGERVATLCWNHHEHLEAYLGVPNGGFVLHTLNFRLSTTDLAHVIAHAGDRAVIVDPDHVELLARALAEVDCVSDVVVVDDGSGALDAAIDGRRSYDYDTLIADADAHTEWEDVPESAPAGMCYTSATTGRPKGIVYTHRSQYLHALTTCIADALAISERDVVLPAVPFFHANAWGLPYSASWMGASQVLPGPQPKSDDIADLVEHHGVTFAAGVPTVWRGVLDAQDRCERDFTSLARVMSGGSAVPAALADEFERRWNTLIVQPYGMTEASPVTHVCRLRSTLVDAPRSDQLAQRSTQGVTLPGLELRLVDDADKDVLYDGVAVGEVLLRGPWVAARYHDDEERSATSFRQGWYRSGDVAVVDEHGYVRLVDRRADLIKSGGEWISSVDLENALMGHDGVAEAAVVAVEDERWDERPVACVVRTPDSDVDEDELRTFLGRAGFVRFWLPDAFIFLDELPRTGVGKFSKRTLREQLRDGSLPIQPSPAGRFA